MFAKHWPGANAAGILRGAYHFYEAELSPTQQAEYFYKTVAQTGDLGELPPVLDVEQAPENLDEIYACLREIEGLFGKKPLLYVRVAFWNSLGPTPWAKTYPLWLAHYAHYLEQEWAKDTLVRMKQRAPSKLPSAWPTWTFWQFTDQAPGAIYGVSDNVGLNFFNGTVEELYAFATTGAPPVETDLLSFALNDRPGGPDRLGYDDYARAFAQVIGSPHTKTPLTIGIYAAWGMGKSFLLGKIKEQ
ncbi:MAG: hypothetical protein GY803_31480, partial [Chloroflexi bacterium]|nr:hypothetical protein [Chloroflexota bacterium]